MVRLIVTCALLLSSGGPLLLPRATPAPHHYVLEMVTHQVGSSVTVFSAESSIADGPVYFASLKNDSSKTIVEVRFIATITTDQTILVLGEPRQISIEPEKTLRVTQPLPALRGWLERLQVPNAVVQVGLATVTFSDGDTWRSPALEVGRFKAASKSVLLRQPCYDAIGSSDSVRSSGYNCVDTENETYCFLSNNGQSCTEEICWSEGLLCHFKTCELYINPTPSVSLSVNRH